MPSTEEYVILQAHKHQSSHEWQEELIVTTVFINDMDQGIIVCEERDMLVSHEMAPDDNTQDNWVKF